MNTTLYKVKYKHNFIKNVVTYFRQPLYQPNVFLVHNERHQFQVFFTTFV